MYVEKIENSIENVVFENLKMFENTMHSELVECQTDTVGFLLVCEVCYQLALLFAKNLL